MVMVIITIHYKVTKK